MNFKSLCAASLLAISCTSWASAADEANANKPDPAAKVSYYREVRLLLQAHCQGCHQPAKAGGKYVMTTFDRLLAGGESEMPAVVPGKPDESHLIEQITPTDGQAEMPQNKPPLNTAEIDLITRWIAQGAVDDTPKNAVVRYDKDHPPVYTRQPVIPALTFSPDGKLLAIAGFHEVLLWKADDPVFVAAPGRTLRADRVGRVLTRRQAPGRHGRPPLPDG